MDIGIGIGSIYEDDLAVGGGSGIPSTGLFADDSSSFLLADDGSSILLQG